VYILGSAVDDWRVCVTAGWEGTMVVVVGAVVVLSRGLGDIRGTGCDPGRAAFPGFIMVVLDPPSSRGRLLDEGSRGAPSRVPPAAVAAAAWLRGFIAANGVRGEERCGGCASGGYQTAGSGWSGLPVLPVRSGAKGRWVMVACKSYAAGQEPGVVSLGGF
jgi:hypothetical protein